MDVKPQINDSFMLISGNKQVGEATIEHDIGNGGQGWVFAARYENRPYALKWYKQFRGWDASEKKQAFRKNLEKNISDGAPQHSAVFLWPELLAVSRKYDTFGYLMPMLPSGFYGFNDFYYGLKRFDSLSAQIQAAFKLVDSFKKLHWQNKSYQDLNGGGFYFKTDGSDIRVGDCDNVAPDGINLGISGYKGFEAPEVVMRKAVPNIYTDLHSLAVVLFRLFFRTDPFEGAKVWSGKPMQGERDYFRHYGLDPVFIYDPVNRSNCPISELHDGSSNKVWNHYPEFFRTAFIYSFGEGLKNPKGRIDENTWEKILKALLEWCS